MGAGKAVYLTTSHCSRIAGETHNAVIVTARINVALDGSHLQATPAIGSRESLEGQASS